MLHGACMATRAPFSRPVRHRTMDGSQWIPTELGGAPLERVPHASRTVGLLRFLHLQAFGYVATFPRTKSRRDPAGGAGSQVAGPPVRSGRRRVWS